MINIYIIIFSILGALGTFLLHQRHKDAVFASASLSLVVGLAFYFFPATLSFLTVKAPVAFFGASFAGMSSLDRIKSWKWVSLSGLIFALIYINTSEFFTGYGGGLGASACLAVIITIGVMKLLKLPQNKKD